MGNVCSICGASTSLQKGMCKKHYDAARRAAMPKNPKKPLRSKYRWINDGTGQGIPVHQVIVEKILGKKLPKGVQIHHVDGNGHNNQHSNLVVCQNQAYHKLLHVRTAALESCGHVDWLKCVRCHQYDDPKIMYLYTPKDQTSPRAEHKECNRKQRMETYNHGNQ